MKILVVGNGGREHALLWKLRRDAPDAELFVTRGNGGTDGLATRLPFDPGDIQPLAGWAEKEGIELTVVGPEAPLADGIADHFGSRGLHVFGPTQLAAEIETSKAFAKALMAQHDIPTASFGTFTEVAAAEAFLASRPGRVVVKASGIAAGKGAVICETLAEARTAVHEMLEAGRFGDAGREIVIEEFMRGEELSVFALCDGEYAVPLLAAQDHKRIGEGETGPNTGGMGAYAPVSLVNEELIARITGEVLQPTLGALAEAGRPFRGLLYAGLMLTEDGPKVIEFNARFGDPETQVILPLMHSSLLEPLLAIARGGSIRGFVPEWHSGCAATTVLASGGYPGPYETGCPIGIPPGVAGQEDVIIFHAGTRRTPRGLVTTGGRVLSVTAFGQTVAAAAATSREAAEQIRFPGRQFRRDIGWRAASGHA